MNERTVLKTGSDILYVRPTSGSIDEKFWCFSVDPIGMGSGDTEDEAIENFIQSLRRTADDLESALKTKSR